MIDARKPNYMETIIYIEELKYLVEKLEKNILFQLPQGVADEFVATKNKFFNWVEEVEFNLENYRKEI